MTDQEMEPIKYFPLIPAYSFGAEKGLGAEFDKIKNMEIEWDRSYTTLVKRGYLIDLFEKRGVLGEFKRRVIGRLATRLGVKACSGGFSASNDSMTIG